MYFVDYHTHCEFSYDSNVPLYDVCEKAINIGLKEIAITDHVDIFDNRAFNHSIDITNRDIAFKEIQKVFKDKIKIVKGIELGQPHHNDKEAKKFYDNTETDFIIGSVHYMRNKIEMDESDYSEMDCKQFYFEYLKEIKELAEYYEYDVLGHLTFPLRYMAQQNNIKLDLTSFKSDFENIFKIVIKRKKGIEVNTSGLRQKLGETMPPKDVLKIYKDCGGQIITVGSDAHIIKDIGQGILEDFKDLKEVGFKTVTVFDKHIPNFETI